MRLDDFSSGQVYVDTNVFYMYLRTDPAHLPAIRSFLNRVVRGEIDAYVGVPVVDELAYRLLLGRIKDATGRNPLDVLRGGLPAAIESHASLVQSAVQQLLSLPHILLVGVDTSDCDRMFDNISAHKLLPRDALHVAIMQRLGLTVIASDDMDFDRVDELERLWATNPPVSTQHV